MLKTGLYMNESHSYNGNEMFDKILSTDFPVKDFLRYSSIHIRLVMAMVFNVPRDLEIHDW